MPLQAPVDILLLFEHQFFDVDALLIEARNFGLPVTDALVERLHRERPGLRYLVGDATEDEVLRTAGIERASGLVAALSDDRANLYVTLSARSLNPSLRIIAKAVEQSAVPKLARAGADKVVSTNRIGGLRRDLAKQSGLWVPAVRVRDNIGLEAMFRSVDAAFAAAIGNGTPALIDVYSNW